MKKILLYLVMLLPCLLLKAQDATYFSCNFSEGMPADFKLYDLDGAEPNDEMQEIGFEKGKAWVVSSFSGLAGCASSTSYNYRVDGKYIQSNKWMVTPGVEVKDANAILTWKADNAGGDDGLDVLISITGDTPEDFTEEPVYSSESEVGSWPTHTIKLEQYLGKTIYIAFVNKNFNQYIISVDDIFVGVASKYSFKLQKQEFFIDTTAISAKGTLTAGLNYTVTGYTVNCLSNGETYSQTYSDLNIEPTGKHNFEVLGIPVKKGEVLDYTVTIDIEGEIHNASERSTNLAFLPNRKVVGEEATATWAGFAPRGFVGMKAMKEAYSTDFIGISVHCSDAESDPMEDEAYAAGIKPLVNMFGLPSGTINRKYRSDPYSSFESSYLRAKKDITIATVAITAEMSKGNKEIKATVSTQFAIDYNAANYRIALALIENNVSGYPQTNAYGDCYYENGPMDGYEDLPAIVPGDQMTYQAVARTILDAFSGLENSIPKEITKDEPVVFTHTITVPEAILKVKNAELIAMLIDNVTGEIKNADKLLLNDIITGIETNKADDSLVDVYQSASGEWTVEVATDQPQQVTASLYSLNGQLINRMEGNNTWVIPANGLKGVYLLKVTIGKELITKKIVL